MGFYCTSVGALNVDEVKCLQSLSTLHEKLELNQNAEHVALTQRGSCIKLRGRLTQSAQTKG